MCATFDVGLVHLHQVSASRAGIVTALTDFPIPFIYTVHDLFIACPTITFHAPDGMYCGAQVDAATCTRCLTAQPAFDRVDIVSWREQHHALMRAAAFRIAPSQWTADTLVPYSSATSTIDAAHDAGLEAYLTTWEGGGHVPYAAHRTEILDKTTNFLYWSLEQRSLTNPAAAPARKTHLWPLLTAWDNGAGREQVQVLSPFEVLFQQNTKIRNLWTPLFALYQYDRQPNATVRHAFLWNAITFRSSPDSKEFHLGPLFDVKRDPERKRWSIGCGLFGFQRAAGGSWRPFLFDFRPKAANKAGSAASP
jgi:hypothetical protein